MSLWRKRNVHHNEQKPDHLVNILTNLSIKSEQKHDNLSNPLDLLHEENVRLGLYDGVYDLSIQSDDLSIKSEKAMREVQRLGQEIEIEYELKAEDDDDIQAYVKPWVGLTEEEKKNIFLKWYGKHWAYTSQLQSVMDSVEAKLKEKNT
jgi:hypothetical protein